MRYVSSIEEITLEEVALKMLKEQVSVEIIARCTGLPINKVKELQYRPI